MVENGNESEQLANSNDEEGSPRLSSSSLLILNFVKSSLSANPCLVSHFISYHLVILLRLWLIFSSNVIPNLGNKQSMWT